MIAPSDEDIFECWLIDMENAIDRFRARLPTDLRENLDGKVASLDLLETWALDRWPNVETAMPSSEGPDLDGAARYLGQTLRKSLGGRWSISFTDARNVYHGVPQLVGIRNQIGQTCPLYMMTTAIDRRTGVTLRSFHDRLAFKE